MSISAEYCSECGTLWDTKEEDECIGCVRVALIDSLVTRLKEAEAVIDFYNEVNWEYFYKEDIDEEFYGFNMDNIDWRKGNMGNEKAKQYREKYPKGIDESEIDELKEKVSSLEIEIKELVDFVNCPNMYGRCKSCLVCKLKEKYSE